MCTSAKKGMSARGSRAVAVFLCMAGMVALGCVEVTGTDEEALFGEFSLRKPLKRATSSAGVFIFADGLVVGGDMDATVYGTFGEGPDYVDVDDQTSGEYGVRLVTVGARHYRRNRRGGVGAHYGMALGRQWYEFEWAGDECYVECGFGGALGGLDLEIALGPRARVTGEFSIMFEPGTRSEAWSAGIELDLGRHFKVAAAYRDLHAHGRQSHVADMDFTLRGGSVRMVVVF
jgi:hypothetical protein